MIGEAERATQLALPGGGSCEPCPFPATCGESGTAHGCGPSPVPGILHPSADDFWPRVREIRGFDFPMTRALDQRRLMFPDYLPQVDPWTTPASIRAGVVAISLARWMKRGGWHLRSSKTMAERLRLGKNARLILLLFGQDELLEALWADRWRFLDALRVLRPDIVVGPGLSVWPSRPALEQRYAQTRGLRFFGLIQDRGFDAVPVVDWGRAKDREAWADWLARNPVTNIAVDLQCLGSSLRPYLAELADLRARLQSNPSLLVNGLAREPRFSELMRVWPEATFTSDPIAVAAHGHTSRARPDGSTTRVRVPGGAALDEAPTLWAAASSISRPELFAREVALITGQIAAAAARR